MFLSCLRLNDLVDVLDLVDHGQDQLPKKVTVVIVPFWPKLKYPEPQDPPHAVFAPSLHIPVNAHKGGRAKTAVKTLDHLCEPERK